MLLSNDRNRRPEVLFFYSAAASILLLCTWKVSHGLESEMDIRLYDESYYLTRGFFSPASKWVADYSPLYSLWFKMVGLFFQDAAALYYANYKVWTFLTGLLTLILLRTAGVGFLPSLLWGMTATASELALPLWPKAGHLAMAGTALGIFGIRKFQGESLSLFIWTTGLGLLLSFCRPEFMAAACAGILFLLPAACFSVSRKFSAVSAIPLVAGIACGLVWGWPVGESGRGMVAFGQHFVHNWRNITGKGPDGMIVDWVNWRPIFSAHFGDARNIPGAFLNNPADALEHIGYNLRYLIHNSLVFFSETLFPVRITGISPFYCLVLLIGIIEWAGRWRPAENLILRLRKCSLVQLTAFLVLALPSILAGLLFQPRPHYLLPLLPFFIYAGGKYFSCLHFQIPEKLKLPLILVLPLLVLWGLPGVNAFFTHVRGNSGSKISSEKQEHFGVISKASTDPLKLIRDLEKFPFPRGFRIFDTSTGATEFLGEKLVQCGKTGFEMNYERLANLKEFLAADSVQGIFLSQTIRYDYFFTGNPFWNDLLSRPLQHGWHKIAVGSQGDSLLLKN